MFGFREYGLGVGLLFFCISCFVFLLLFLASSFLFLVSGVRALAEGNAHFAHQVEDSPERESSLSKTYLSEST